MKQTRFPNAIEIQTTSYCNAKCIICPHSQTEQILPSGTMSIALFRVIIDQINPQWGCRIIPYLNNEPFLDQLMVPRLQYVVERLKNPEIELSTNMSVFTPAKQEEMAGIKIKELRLSLFGFTEQTHHHMMPGLRWETVKQNLDYLITESSLRKYISEIGIVMIQHPLVTREDIVRAQKYCKKHSLSFNLWGFLDRAGNVAQYSNEICRPVIFGCEQNRPVERMHITFTGDVILCCQDWKWHNVIGNIQQQTLLEVWNSHVYNQHRKNIYLGKGKQPDICTRCKLSLSR